MFKKYMCLVLCILMALSAMSTTALAANVAVDGLTATHVTFTDASGEAITKLPAKASTVKASVNVSNTSAADAPVILWVGKYESDVLTDVAVTRRVISAGATDVSVSVAIDDVERNEKRETADGPVIDLTTLKAYVWTGMVGGKALAAPACFPSSTIDVAYATLDGEVWTEFSNATTDYTLSLGVNDTVPTVGMVAKDNAAKITVPTLKKGENTITVVGADSTTNSKSYKINLDFTILAKKNGEVWTDFDRNVTDYVITLGENDAMPTFDFSINAAANVTISQPTGYFEGKNTVTFTDNDTSKATEYNIIIKKGIVAKKNGEIWTEFDENVHEYNFDLSASEAIPTFTFENVGGGTAVITQPATWVEGYNTITIDRNGYVDEYKIGITYPLIATMDGAAWDDFTSTTYSYSFNLSRTQCPPVINFAASKPESTITITQPTSYGEGNNVVTVERANGHKKTYTISLDYASPTVEISDAGNSGATYIHKFFGSGSGLATDRMNWTAGGVGAGTQGMRYFTVGWRDAAYRTWNTGNTVSFKFRSDVGGTMYVITNTAYKNYQNAGWTQLSTGMFSMPTIDGVTYTSETLPLDYVAPDNDGQNMGVVWYQNATTRSYPSTLSVCYKLRFEAGQLVEVPTTNSTGDAYLLPLVKWDVPQPPVMDNAKLNSIQYEKSAGNYITIPGFDPDVTEYDVRVDSGVTSVVVKASTAEISATVASYGSSNTSIDSSYGIIPLKDGVGKAEIKVVAPDGETTKTYTVNIKAKKANSELPNKVYNLYTSRESGVYTENGGYFSESDRTNGNISYAGIEDNLDASSYWYSDRTNTAGKTGTSYAGATYIRIPKNDMNERYIWTYDGVEKSLCTGWGYRYYEDADWTDPNTGVNTLYSFNVSSDATVYYLSSDSSLNWSNGTSAGWKANSANSVFYKEFKAGDKVNIPTLSWNDNWGARGESALAYFDSVVPAYMTEHSLTSASQLVDHQLFGGIYDPFKIVIVWKDPSASVSNDTSIKAIKLNDVAIEDYTDDNTNSVDVSLEKGTASAKLQLETKDANATVTYYIDNVEQTTNYANVTTFPATVKAKITSSDDSTDRVVLLSVAVEDTERVAALTGISYKLGDGESIAIAGFDKDTLTYEVSVDPTKAITVTATGDENSSVIAPTDAVNIPFDADLTKAVKTVDIKAKNGSAVKIYKVTFKPELVKNHIYNLGGNMKMYLGNNDETKVVPTLTPSQSPFVSGATATIGYPHNSKASVGKGIWYDTFYSEGESIGNWTETSVTDNIEFGKTLRNNNRGESNTAGNKEVAFIESATHEIFKGATAIRRGSAETYPISKITYTYNTETSTWAKSNAGLTIQPYWAENYSGQDGNPYWMTFYISSPATVYVDVKGMPEMKWQYGEADGWTKDTTHLVNNYATYKKHFDQGIVNIPNVGVGTTLNAYDYVHTPNGYVVVWGDDEGGATPPTPPTPVAQPKLSTFVYKIGTADAGDVTGWTASDTGEKTYNITVPYGTTSVTIDATADDGAAVTPETKTIDVSSGSGSATFSITAESSTSTFTVNVTVAEFKHELVISYTEDRTNALKATVVEDASNGSSVTVGDQFSFAADGYTYTDDGLAVGSKVMLDRDWWRAVHVSGNLLGMSTINTSIEEFRNSSASAINRGSGEWKCKMTPNASAKEWFCSETGTWFEFTPNMAGTLYLITNYSAPTWEKKYTRVELNTTPTEFTGYTDKKLLPFETVITSRDYYLSVQQYKNGYKENQFEDDAKTTLISNISDGTYATYGNVFKIDFKANEKTPVSVPGNLLNDGAVLLVEWADKKVADPVLSTLKYEVGSGMATDVEGFTAATKEYTVNDIDADAASVTVSATAPEGMTVTITQPTFDDDGKGTATIVVKSGAYKSATYTVTFKKAAPAPAPTVLKADTIYNLTMNSGYYASGNYPAPPTEDEIWEAGTVKLGRDGVLKDYVVYNPNDEDRTGEYFCDYYVADGATDTYDKMFVVRNMVIPTKDDNSDGTDKYNDRQNNNRKKISYNTSDYFKGATLISRKHSDTSEAVSANWKIKEGNTIGKNEWAISKWELVTPYLKGATCEPYISGVCNGKDGNPYWMEFIVSSGATVFVTDPWNEGWINAPADWTKNSSSSVLLDGKTAFYYKHYNAGEKVQIPNWGMASSWTDSTVLYDPPIYVVVWDSAQPTGPEGAIEDGGEGVASL